jgi:predicted cupin superfamily sugar epimerase
MFSASTIIKNLQLNPNEIEGGYFKSTYESPILLTDTSLPGFAANGSGRSLCGAIFYFLESGGCSVMHRVTGDMLYHFYSGDPVQMLLLYPDNFQRRSEVFTFSNRLDVGGIPMKLIPGGTWLGSRVAPGGQFALMGVTMAPGFDPIDYSIGDARQLIQQYPEEAALITLLTRPTKD